MEFKSPASNLPVVGFRSGGVASPLHHLDSRRRVRIAENSETFVAAGSDLDLGFP